MDDHITLDAPPCAAAASVTPADDKQLWEMIYHLEHLSPNLRDFFIAMGALLAEQPHHARGFRAPELDKHAARRLSCYLGLSSFRSE